MRIALCSSMIVAGASIVVGCDGNSSGTQTTAPPAPVQNDDGGRLKQALVSGDVRAVASLLDAKPSLLNEPLPGRARVTPIVVASELGSIDLVRILLERGARADFDSNGATALHCAALRADPAFTKALLDAGPELTLFDNQTVERR